MSPLLVVEAQLRAALFILLQDSVNTPTNLREKIIEALKILSSHIEDEVAESV